jgi:hypothetical protein
VPLPRDAALRRRRRIQLTHQPRCGGILISIRRSKTCVPPAGGEDPDPT